MELYYVAFSDIGKEVLRREVKESTRILRLNQKNVYIFDFKVRHFPKYRQEILDTLIKLREEIKPTVVFTPSLKDVHQDHQVVTSEALRAFKKTALTILGYEEPWNCFTFSATVFIVLEEKHVRRKIEALKKYESQMDRDYMNEEFIMGLARTRGTQIGEKYAEAFEIMRWVIK